MAAEKQWWNVALVWLAAALRRLLASLKSQWLATALVIPLGFLALQTYVARQDAREARRQSISIERISKVQESGKALDAALASYIQATAELGLAERHLKMPGTNVDVPVPQAKLAVVEARKEARKALASHAGDVESVRGVFDQVATAQYTAALADVNDRIESEADIGATGRNVTVLAKMVKARRTLVEKAVGQVS